MSDYAEKLFSIAEKKQKLLEEESKLIDKRKKEIIQLAEKFDLLTMTDALLIGLFNDAQTSVKEQSDKIKLWESCGEQYLKSKRNLKPAQESAV